MADDDVLRRWMGLEAHRMTEGNVVQPIALALLLEMPEPTARTRVGGAHAFDRDALARMGERLDILLRHDLRLPMTFYVPHDLPGDAYLEDASAIRALQELGETTAEPRQGRLWMSLPLVVRLRERWPTLVQTMPV